MKVNKPAAITILTIGKVSKLAYPSPTLHILRYKVFLIFWSTVPEKLFKKKICMRNSEKYLSFKQFLRNTCYLYTSVSCFKWLIQPIPSYQI